ELIRAAVHVGQYSEPKAEKLLGDVLIKRRDKIKTIYLNAVNPIVSPKLENGRLTFDNAAVAAGVATAPSMYHASWFRFDNATGESQPISDTQGSSTTLDVPSGLPSSAGSFVRVDISADSPEHATWKKPIQTYFKRGADGWKLIGLERLPEAS